MPQLLVFLHKRTKCFTATPQAPVTFPLTLSESGDTLGVYEGDVVLRLPVAQNARAMEQADGTRVNS